MDQAVKEIIDWLENHDACMKQIILNPSEKEEWARRKSAIIESAYIARFSYNEGVQYIIKEQPVQNPNGSEDPEKKEKVVIIVDNHNTGELKKSSRWENYLHEFLELKHGLAVKRSTEAAAIKSTVDFFDSYGSNLFGMTGTLGDDSTTKFLRDTYNVITIDIPRSNKNRKVLYEPILELSCIDGSNCSPVSDELLEFVCERVNQGQPCLIINDAIKKAQTLLKQLPQLILTKTGRQIKTKEFYMSDVENLHQSVKNVRSDEIIFATALAGRGTDIQLSEEAKNKGGLAVILTYLPASIRTQRQNEGRSGRNGENGSSVMIISSLRGEKAKTAKELIILRDLKEKIKLQKDAEMVLSIRREDRINNQVKEAASKIQITNPARGMVLLQNFQQQKKLIESNENLSELDAIEIEKKANELIQIALNPQEDFQISDYNENFMMNLIQQISGSKTEVKKFKEKLEVAEKNPNTYNAPKIKLIKAMVLVNAGENQQAKQELEKLAELEQKQSAHHLLLGAAHLNSQIKAKTEEIVDFVAQTNDPNLKQLLADLGQNYSEEKGKQIANRIKSHAKVSLAILEAFSYLEDPAVKHEEVREALMREIMENNKEYAVAKELTKKVIEHNLDKSKSEKLYIAAKANSKSLSDIECEGKDGKDSKGKLGYVLGGVMVLGACFCCCRFDMPDLGKQICLKNIECGLKLIEKNAQMNETGTYSTGSMLYSAGDAAIAAFAVPLAEEYLIKGSIKFCNSNKEMTIEERQKLATVFSTNGKVEIYGFLTGAVADQFGFTMTGDSIRNSAATFDEKTKNRILKEIKDDELKLELEKETALKAEQIAEEEAKKIKNPLMEKAGINGSKFCIFADLISKREAADSLIGLTQAKINSLINKTHSNADPMIHLLLGKAAADPNSLQYSRNTVLEEISKEVTPLLSKTVEKYPFQETSFFKSLKPVVNKIINDRFELDMRNLDPILDQDIKEFTDGISRYLESDLLSRAEKKDQNIENLKKEFKKTAADFNKTFADPKTIQSIEKFLDKSLTPKGYKKLPPQIIESLLGHVPQTISSSLQSAVLQCIESKDFLAMGSKVHRFFKEDLFDQGLSGLIEALFLKELSKSGKKKK